MKVVIIQDDMMFALTFAGVLQSWSQLLNSCLCTHDQWRRGPGGLFSLLELMVIWIIMIGLMLYK